MSILFPRDTPDLRKTERKNAPHLETKEINVEHAVVLWKERIHQTEMLNSLTTMKRTQSEEKKKKKRNAVTK